MRYWEAAVAMLLLVGTVHSRTQYLAGDKGPGGQFALQQPYHCSAVHRIGKLVLTVNNNGTFGSNYSVAPADCFTGNLLISCEYPKGSNTTYLFGGAFWIGAVVGRDTLVSVGADGWTSGWREMYPDEEGFARVERRSIVDPTQPEFEGAISEEDYVFVYTDTYTVGVPNDYFQRPHRPLNIEVTQSSFAWSYSYAEDFVLFDYQIRNIGSRRLENVYMGLYVDADVCFGATGCDVGYDDDICGFLHTIETEYRDTAFIDTVNIAWIADGDGDLENATAPDAAPLPHVTAMRIVRTPATELDVSFNWWIGNGNPLLDFGPREKPFQGELKEAFRDFRTGGLGTPEGDINKYYQLRNREFDYDQVYTASIGQNDPLWLFPQSGGVTRNLVEDFADGYDTRYLLSFGPFDISPGQRLPISFAYVAGEDFHTYLDNINNLPDNPGLFYDSLHFEDLATNAIWASWIYDNPGVDTDGDGYAGKNRIVVIDTTVIDLRNCRDTVIDTVVVTICDTIYAVVDTLWYEGDGVPDFRGASPPPAPELWVTPSVGKLHLRFNGTRSETTRDVFSRLQDFEGYKVYIGRDARAASYSLYNSFDREDFNKFVFDEARNQWNLVGTPYTRDQLTCIYGDSCGDPFFDPLVYTRTSYLVLSGPWGDSLISFEPQAENQSQLGLPRGIRKRFPDQPYPSSLIPDSARPEELTPDGYLKYFEYEIEIEDLLPTVPYWVNVTAFDYGSPESGLDALETSVSVGAVSAYPLSSGEDVAAQDLKVLVYPNPYRIDAGYRNLGLEGRTQGDRPDDRVRQIHFANLPAKCTIRIYSLDGDLVREIVHDRDVSDPNAAHDTWDLITRNTQLVVSGLYYWTVEEPDGTVQIGKLAIIM